MELGKLAIDYSDGIIGTSEKANAALIGYARDNDKPLLEHAIDDDQLKDKYSEFYGRLI